MEGHGNWQGKRKRVAHTHCHGLFTSNLTIFTPAALRNRHRRYFVTHNNQGYINANNFLEKRYQDDMELEDAIHTALLTLREGFEGEMNGHNIEVGVVSKADGKFRLLTPEQIQDYLDEAN